MKTKKAVVEEALRRLVMLSRQAKVLKELKGSVKEWEGDLKGMRKDRSISEW
ncbi:MAG: hypothetical protein PHD91_00710 [bacterium]|nr:hypothetical protein [bacterium]MDD3806015.1 hypothetical protein [bacterium]MDD4152221.1 hypothetical protein [bacterium]MDD4558722.1 hypothetical protein [bacterium]